jgi:hypothetical protein
MDEQIDVTELTRHELEMFTVEASNKLISFQERFTELQSAFNLSSIIDPDVIQGWQDWIEILDKERDKWANIATKTSQHNVQLLQENNKSIQKIEILKNSLGQILEITKENSADTAKKTLELQQAINKINKIAELTINENTGNMVESIKETKNDQK